MVSCFLIIFLSLEAVHVFIFLSQEAVLYCLESVTCMCTYLSIFSKPWAVYVSVLCEFGHWVCGESWLAIKDL